jgi:hypothetical protein
MTRLTIAMLTFTALVLAGLLLVSELIELSRGNVPLWPGVGLVAAGISLYALSHTEPRD